jgi:hypothetical protein
VTEVAECRCTVFVGIEDDPAERALTAERLGELKPQLRIEVGRRQAIEARKAWPAVNRRRTAALRPGEVPASRNVPASVLGRKPISLDFRGLLQHVGRKLAQPTVIVRGQRSRPCQKALRFATKLLRPPSYHAPSPPVNVLRNVNRIIIWRN